MNKNRKQSIRENLKEEGYTLLGYTARGEESEILAAIAIEIASGELINSNIISSHYAMKGEEWVLAKDITLLFALSNKEKTISYTCVYAGKYKNSQTGKTKDTQIFL